MVGLPSSFVVLFWEEEEEKEEEEEADEEDMHFRRTLWRSTCRSAAILDVSYDSLFWLVGFTGDDAPRVKFPSAVVWPKMLASWLVRTRRPVMWRDALFFFDSGMCKAGVAVCAHLAMCSRQAQMLRIMAGMNQKDLFAHFPAVACSRLALLVFYTSRCVSSLVGRPMMLGIMAGMNQRDIFALFVDPCRDAEVFSHGPDCSSDH